MPHKAMPIRKSKMNSSGVFMAGSFTPPINYGIQSPAIGRGGPGVPLNGRAAHLTPMPPIWSGTITNLAVAYPYGSASSHNTRPVAPNLWTAYTLPYSQGVMKQQTGGISF